MTERAGDRAYRLLRAEILDLTLAPGTLLPEVEQAARLGVSRTPLREALARLTADGLVVAQGGRGMVVTEVSIENIRELYELRGALEEQAARLAAERRDPDRFRELADAFASAPKLLDKGETGITEYYRLIDRFDDALDDAVANAYLVGALDAVRTHLIRIRRLARSNPDRLRWAAREHAAIIDAIIEGDARLAADATHVHLSESLRSVLRAASDQTASAA
jgi:DNA-binding GntR family transcriptional regulator